MASELGCRFYSCAVLKILMTVWFSPSMTAFLTFEGVVMRMWFRFVVRLKGRRDEVVTVGLLKGSRSCICVSGMNHALCMQLIMYTVYIAIVRSV